MPRLNPPSSRWNKQGVEKHTVTPAYAGVQCDGLCKINAFRVPACAGMTD